MSDRQEDRPPRRPWRFFAALFGVAFALNWPWEMLQMPAYVELAGRSWREVAPRCTVATLGDAAITLAIYGVGALAAGRWRWGMEGGWNVYASAVLLGALSAVAVEWVALGEGRWSYSARMPVVPGLRVGLWPLLQLSLLVPASFWIAGRVAKQRNAEAER